VRDCGVLRGDAAMIERRENVFPDYERDYERNATLNNAPRIEEVKEEEEDKEEEVREKKDGELSSITKYYDRHRF